MKLIIIKSRFQSVLEIMEIAWKLFFNEDHNLLQKNTVRQNDIFTNPVDITDNNIPNGNSVYFYVINKLHDITENSSWNDKLNKLSQSFHAFINTNFSQMFSYYKSLDIYEEKITFTIYGNFDQKNNFFIQYNEKLFWKEVRLYIKKIMKIFL